MLHGAQRTVRAFDPVKSNRFLAALPPADYALLTPHLRPVTLERGAVLYDVGDDIEHVYFPHSGMVSLVTVMQYGATVETATVGRGGVIGATGAAAQSPFVPFPPLLSGSIYKIAPDGAPPQPPSRASTS